ncbi:MAG: response regulator [Caulobacteraceae bacterium]
MKKILVVDDAAFMRAAIRTMLERNGFEVVGEAENGMVGFEKYKELKPDVVTLDTTMPEMDGLEALKAIKQYDPKAKVIMVSAMGQEPMVMDAVVSGAKSFIVKPFKEEHVVQTLNKVLAL